jgi:hypothetical protein
MGCLMKSIDVPPSSALVVVVVVVEEEAMLLYTPPYYNQVSLFFVGMLLELRRRCW